MTNITVNNSGPSIQLTRKPIVANVLKNTILSLAALYLGYFRKQNKKINTARIGIINTRANNIPDIINKTESLPENFRIDITNKSNPKRKNGQAALFIDEYHLALCDLVLMNKNKAPPKIPKRTKIINPGQMHNP